MQPTGGLGGGGGLDRPTWVGSASQQKARRIFDRVGVVVVVKVRIKGQAEAVGVGEMAGRQDQGASGLGKRATKARVAVIAGGRGISASCRGMRRCQRAVR